MRLLAKLEIISLVLATLLLSFVLLITLGIGLYVGESMLLAIGTAILSGLYNISIRIQKNTDFLDAVNRRVDTLEKKVFR